MTTSGAASDENVVNMTTFWFQCLDLYRAPAKPQHVDCHISIGLPVTRRFPSQRASNAGNVSIC